MTQLTGRVLYQGDPGWDEARREFNSRVNYDASMPHCIVFCQCAKDAVNAVRWARENSVPLRARCGRHSYEGFAQVRDGIIIDVSDLDTLSTHRDLERAVAGSGLYMLEFFEKLWDVGRAVPGATGSSVGLAGMTLGGGFGMISRKFGLTCDHLEEVELVNADGELMRASREEHPDLFWACQGGGGGNFGIATELVFRTRRVGLVAAFNVSWEWSAFEPLVDRWQDWAFEVEDSMSTFLRLGADRRITLFGQYTPDDPRNLHRGGELLQELFAVAPPQSLSLTHIPYMHAARSFFGVDPMHPAWLVDPHSDQQTFKSTSAFAYKRFGPQPLTILREAMENSPQSPNSPSQPNMIQLLGGGGVSARVPRDATAAYHRQARFILQYDAYWTAPQDEAPNVQWTRDIRSALSPYTEGAYVNYHDADLTDYLRAYYGTNLERLVQVKRRYDPGNVFQFAQSIPTSLP